MSLLTQYKTLSKDRPWIARTFVSLVVLVVLLILIRASLPFAINVGATSWLESKGVEAKILDTKISLWDGSLKIYKASGKNKSGQGFSFDYLGISWQWAPLFDRLVKIDQVEVKSLNVDARFVADGNMNIAGIDIKSDADELKPESSESENPWDATIQNITLSNLELCLQQFDEKETKVVDYCGKLADVRWTGDASFKPSVQPEETDVPPVYAQGELDLHDIELQNKQLKLNLLSVGSIAVRNINVDTPTNIQVGSVDIEKLSAMQRANKSSVNDAQVFAFDRLAIQPITLLQQNNLQLGKIELIGNRSYVQVDKDGHMEFQKWLPGKQKPVARSADKPTEKKETAKAVAEPFNFSFNEFVIDSKHHSIFIDNSLKDPFTSDIHNINFKLEELDSKEPDKLSHISLAFAVDKHGSLKLDADISPLSERPNVKGKGEILGFDLRALSPYTRQHVGHHVKSGQLDADLNINVEKGVIDSNIGLVLHHFELKSLSKKEADELNSEFGFPLNTSLSLLRDRGNAIRLDIPVSGDVESPDFDPKNAILKASSKAITTAVLHYYTPFGLVFAAEGLFNLATALNFEPVLFAAGENKLTTAHKEQLDKLVTLMADRPGIHLTLCGTSNLADKNMLFPELVKTKPQMPELQASDQQKKVKPLSKENLASLRQLAESRSSNLKHYLVNEKAIKASRLVECAPEYVPEKISGVEISI